jgi:MFS transporter, PAT family, beta-lactamase induction signal transducer AmpG
MIAKRRLPPIWIMGMTNAVFGLTGGFCAVIVPEMLAAHGLPAGKIASIAATILSPGFWAFAIAPMLDVRLSRRTYALIFGTITALCVSLTFAFPDRSGIIEAVMLPGFLSASLYQGAVGGWMGSLISKEQDSELGIWFTVSNLGAGGLMMAISGEAFHRFTSITGAFILGGIILLPMSLFFFIPAPGPDRQLARESFGRFWSEVASLVRQRDVLIALLLFAMPVASFALTNVLAGAGRDFSASERMVSLSAGIGSTIAGLAGSFLLFPLARRFSLRPLYLGIGLVGAFFTLSLMSLPHAPWSFAVAITGQNLFQAMAFSTSNAICFEVIGPNNPLAATLYTLLISASNLPITYMQYLDGRGYDRGGLIGSYLTDALISITACSLLAWFLSRRRGNLKRSHKAFEPIPDSPD